MTRHFHPAPHQRRMTEAPSRSLWFAGLGSFKTSSALVRIRDAIMLDQGPVLVAAPKAVAEVQWPSEIKKWDAFEDLRFRVITAADFGLKRTADKQGRKTLTFDKQAARASLARDLADIHVCPYHLLHYLAQAWGPRSPYTMLVLDECHHLLDPTTSQTKAAMHFSKTAHQVFGLTGSWGERYEVLYSLAKLVDGGAALGATLTRFRNSYLVPDKRRGMTVFSWKLQPGAKERIQDAIAPFTVVLRTEDHATLPELQVNDFLVDLPAPARKAYDAMEDDQIAILSQQRVITAAHAGAAQNKLRQMANGCVYSNDPAQSTTIHIHDAKLDALEALTESHDGPLLVAIQFDHDRERIRKRFPLARFWTGDEAPEWNAGHIKMLVAHPAQISEGLNLQSGGCHVVWYGICWSRSSYDQLNGRLFRPGQRAVTVFVTRILARSTVDEVIASALDEKRDVQQSLIDALLGRQKEVV